MTPEYCLSPSCSELAQVRAMLHEITEQNDRLELENGILLSSRNDWKELAKAKDARVAELEALETRARSVLYDYWDRLPCEFAEAFDAATRLQ